MAKPLPDSGELESFFHKLLAFDQMLGETVLEQLRALDAHRRRVSDTYRDLDVTELSAALHEVGTSIDSYMEVGSACELRVQRMLQAINGCVGRPDW